MPKTYRCFFRFFELLLWWWIGSLNILPVWAEGDYYNLGTYAASSGNYDAVSWSSGNPVTLDKYGKMIVPIQSTDGSYYWAVSNNGGKTWTDLPIAATITRPTVAYDPVNDKLHVLAANNMAFYLRYNIARNSDQDITAITQNTGINNAILDNATDCTSVSFGFPILLFKSDGNNGKLVAFWSVNKTCGGEEITANRAGMIDLANDDTDGDTANWKALNGTSDASGDIGPAAAGYNNLWKYVGDLGAAYSNAQSAVIKDCSTGSHCQDIYYFYKNEGNHHNFRRLEWNTGSSNWAGSWTTGTQYGGTINTTNGIGYSLNHELITKPIYADYEDRIYLGIARWIDAAQGDSQSLYYIDAEDNIILAGDAYSADGAAFLYPTLDITLDATNHRVYIFYLTSGDNPGHVFYEYYSNDTFSPAYPFFTASGETVDIPIVYEKDYGGRFLLVFRKNNTVTPNTPPHEVFFGSLRLDGTPPATQGTLIDTDSNDFNSICASRTNTAVTTAGGQIALTKTNIESEFNNPLDDTFEANWTYGTWSGGSYSPATSGGTMNIYDDTGAYIMSRNAASQKTFEARAYFSGHDWQHLGWVNNTSFNEFIMFSTSNNGQLNARVFGVLGGEFVDDSVNLGTSYYNAYHTYKIDWETNSITFFVDGNQVAQVNRSNPDALLAIASNNSTWIGSDLNIDWIRASYYPNTTGSFQSCTMNSDLAYSLWGNAGLTASVTGNDSVAVQIRRSDNNTAWGSWMTVSDGEDIPGSGRFLQYKLNFTGTSYSSPVVSDISFPYYWPILEFTEENSSGNEGVTPVTVNLSLSETMPVDVTATISDNGTATEKNDYLFDNNTATIRASQTAAAVAVGVIDDNEVEGSETVALTLSAPAFARLGTNSTYTYTILDNDTPLEPSLTPSPIPTDTPAPTSTLIPTQITPPSPSVGLTGTTAPKAADTANSSSTSPPPECQDAPLGNSKPWIHGAAAKDANSIYLYFTPADEPVDKYVLKYGTTSRNYQYGALDMGVNSRDQMTFLVESLSPNTTYYFKIRAGNGCATGEWSNEISAKTKRVVQVNNLDFVSLEFEPDLSPDQDCQTYIVQPEDNLWLISQKLLGSGNRYKEIVEENKEKYDSLGKSDIIRQGWELKVNCNTKKISGENPGDETLAKKQEEAAGHHVTIKVVDVKNKPVEGAAVTIHSKVQTTKTDKDGVAQFSNVESGEHKILVAYSIYKGEHSINLADEAKEIDVTIKIHKESIKISPLIKKIMVITGLAIAGLAVLKKIFIF